MSAQDFVQTYLRSEQEVLNSVRTMTPKDDDQVLAILKKHIERRVEEAEIAAPIRTVMRLLMFQGLEDEDVVAWGRSYFTKYISSSVPVWQTILKDIETMPFLPNDETELRGIRLAKEICVSLIRDFGTVEVEVTK